jgi:hypothetical protein
LHESVERGESEPEIALDLAGKILIAGAFENGRLIRERAG